jgi:hypothetical protein
LPRQARSSEGSFEKTRNLARKVLPCGEINR